MSAPKKWIKVTPTVFKLFYFHSYGLLYRYKRWTDINGEWFLIGSTGSDELAARGQDTARGSSYWLNCQNEDVQKFFGGFC
jgi:hypothetical protein